MTREFCQTAKEQEAQGQVGHGHVSSSHPETAGAQTSRSFPPRDHLSFTLKFKIC